MSHRSAAPSTVHVTMEGCNVEVRAGSSVAAALALRPPGVTRRSVSGQWRAPFCGMGVCQECRVLIDGHERLACQTICEDGMRISTTDSSVANSPSAHDDDPHP